MESNNFKWITVGTSQIVYLDYRKLTVEEYLIRLKEGMEFIKKQNRTDLLLLFETEGTRIFGEALKGAIEFAKELKHYRKKSAFLGIEGAKKLLLNSILTMTGAGNVVRTFDNIEAAKKWLIS